MIKLLTRLYIICDVRRLECVQDSLAKMVAEITKYWHMTPARKSLHCLPIKYLTVFKRALLVFKFLQSGCRKYFEPFLRPMYRTLRSQSGGLLLEVPHFAYNIKVKNDFAISFEHTAQKI